MKNKETNTIKDVWYAISYNLNNIDWTHHADELLKLSLVESKQHDKFRGAMCNPRGISVLTEAQYFAIKRLYEYRYTNDTLDAKDYIATQKSCFYAYAIAHDQRFSSAWDKIALLSKTVENMQLIASWDYCDLIKSEDRRKGFKKSPVNNEVTA